MAGLLWYRSYMDSLANTSGYYPDIHAGHADRVAELTLDAPYLVRETPAGYNKLELMELVGGSVAWNQMATVYTGTRVGVTIADGGSGVVTLSGTTTASYFATHTVQAFTQNHVYFMHLIVNANPNNVPFSFSPYNLSGDFGINQNGGTKIAKWTSASKNSSIGVGSIAKNVSVDGIKLRYTLVNLTLMLGSAIADYVYSLEQSTAGSGIAWLKSYGFFEEDYIAYSAPTLQSVEGTSHIAKDGNGNVISTTTFGAVTLRGITELVNGTIRYNGDTYEPDGTVTRYFGERAYQTGDESLTDAITDGTNTVYKLVAPTTESADPYTAVQDVAEGGTEEFVTGNNIPVGNVSVYRRA